MVKKAKAAKKRKPSASSNQPLAALYHLEEGTPRGDAVRAVLSSQGIRIKTVAESQLGNPVGAIVGMTGFHPSTSPYEGEIPPGEFLLLYNFSSTKTNDLLAAMREANASVGCKAQVTQYNRLWPFATLIREVTREHEAMTAASSN